MVWPMLAAGAAVGGGMLTLVGSAKSAKAQRAAADYNAKIMERNAEMAEQAGKQQIFMKQLILSECAQTIHLFLQQR